MTFRLVITSVSSGQAHTVDLDRDIVLVGRRVGVDVPLPHPDVGGVHLRIERQGDAFQLIDGGARSGTRLNGEPVPSGGRRPLSDGAVILVGDAFSLRFDARSPAVSPTPEAGTVEMARAMVRDVLAALGRANDSPTFEVTAGPAAGKRIEVPAHGRELVLGRGETCDAVIVDADLSREHVRVRRDFTGVTLCDLGSKNGTTVDGDKLVPGVDHRLTEGARIAAGATVLVFHDPAEAYLSSLRAPAPEPATGPEPPSMAAPAPPATARSIRWLPVVLAVALIVGALVSLVSLLR